MPFQGGESFHKKCASLSVRVHIDHVHKNFKGPDRAKAPGPSNPEICRRVEKKICSVPYFF